MSVRPNRTACAKTRLLAALAVAAAAIDAHAALPEALYIQGVALDGASAFPGFTTGDTVRSNGSRRAAAAVNGNFVGAVNTNPSQGNAGFAGAYYLFGSTDGGQTPTTLRREGTVAGQSQESFSTAIAIDNAGDVAYTGTINGVTGRRSTLWNEDTIIAQESVPFAVGALTGLFPQSFAGLHRSPTGVTSWVSNYSDSASGSTTGTAILRGEDTFGVLLRTGDMISQVGAIVGESGAISSNIGWSALGTNYVVEVDIALGFQSNDEVLVINGQPALTRSGAVIREGAVLPEIDGGLPGETWDPVNLPAINQAGDFAFGAFTSAADTLDSVLAFNGAVLHREGDVVDGRTLTGQVQGVALNDRGDLAFAWGDAVFVNDRVVATLGTLVDTNGDGVGDSPLTNIALDQLTITNLVAAGGEQLPVVYFAGRVNGQTAMVRLAPPSLSGDYNGDGAVNAADYTAWRDSLGSSLLLSADGDRSNQVDAADYTVWGSQYGASSAGAAAGAAVPEPASAVVALLGGLAYLGRRRR